MTFSGCRYTGMKRKESMKEESGILKQENKLRI